MLGHIDRPVLRNGGRAEDVRPHVAEQREAEGRLHIVRVGDGPVEGISDQRDADAQQQTEQAPRRPHHAAAWARSDWPGATAALRDSHGLPMVLA